jgi:hypothetical protein
MLCNKTQVIVTEIDQLDLLTKACSEALERVQLRSSALSEVLITVQPLTVVDSVGADPPVSFLPPLGIRSTPLSALFAFSVAETPARTAEVQCRGSLGVNTGLYIPYPTILDP